MVIVVDHSGSMRKSDVANYPNRTAAVYDCLAKDFVTAQIAAGATGADIVVSVIEMTDRAKLIINKSRLDESLAKALQARGKSQARSHGNYLPALDMSLEILQHDASNRGTLMLLFLSDGAPSDHLVRECSHGCKVWQEMGNGATRSNGKMALIECPSSRWGSCRKEAQEGVHRDCIQRILQIGDVLGRDRVVVGTVAFGDPSQDYSVLKKMGEALPRGSFQKLGLNAGGLRTAFSSLSSSLTTLRTDGGSRQLTLRDRQVKKVDRTSEIETTLVSNSNGWFIYNGERYVEKYKYVLSSRELVRQDFPTAGMTGVAFVQQPFAQGVERLVYRCAEVTIPTDRLKEWYDDTRADFPATARALRGKLRLVAKEAKHMQNLGRRFQLDMARIQAEAAEMAHSFNRRVAGPPKMQLTFLECAVYNFYDNTYPDKEAWVLVEQELEGKFRKWNNNNGNVYRQILEGGGTSAAVGEGGGPSAAAQQASLLSIIEEDEHDEDDEPAPTVDVNASFHDVPQCFSHFTYETSGGRSLVCDLQGVWNAADGFVLTDPVIHHVSRYGTRRHKNGGTDKGAQGVLSFFRSHTCGDLCRRLGLTTPDMARLAADANEEARMCLVCMNEPRATRFGPCRHASCCVSCANTLMQAGHRCPICREAITTIIERGAHIALQLTHQ